MSMAACFCLLLRSGNLDHGEHIPPRTTGTGRAEVVNSVNNPSPTPTSQLWKGVFKNFNTIEQFRSPQMKKEMFDSIVAKVKHMHLFQAEHQMVSGFQDDDLDLNTFLLVAFADLKKYTYHYWFAFPALVSKPAWQLHEPFGPVDETVSVKVSSAHTKRGRTSPIFANCPTPCRKLVETHFW